MKIVVEAPRKKNYIVQCTRCQSYGHTKSYCSRPYVCVKCGGEHNSTVCTKDTAAPATRALCGGEYPASYKGCIIYKNLQQARSKTHRTIHPTAVQIPTPPVNITDTSKFPPFLATHTLPQYQSPHPPHSPILLHTITSRSPQPNSCQTSLLNSNRCSIN
jgi:hypothetical protein